MTENTSPPAASPNRYGAPEPPELIPLTWGPMGPLERVTTTEARRSWNRLIEQVVDNNTPVLITRYGQPAAVLAPMTPISANQSRHPY